MEEGKLFEVYFDLPDGYQVQMMVLMEIPEKRPRVAIYRSRVWIGHEAEAEPMLYKSQEHADLRQAIDGCYSILLQRARHVVSSPIALEAIQQQAHSYFSGPVSQAR